MEEYQLCKRCVMDTTACEIEFDSDGVCNFCTNYLNNRKKLIKNPNRENELNEIVSKIKKEGEKKQYNCIIGVSGGTDSTYVAYVVQKLGLKPLAVHLDNGWDSELAVSNIEKTLEKLDIELYTYVLDWEEFKSLQKSFLYASTPDTELPTDHAIRTILLSAARKHKIKYIINERNFSTEGILPTSWSYGPFDWKYIKEVHRIHGNSRLSTFPHLDLKSLFFHYAVRRVRDISILNYVPYHKKEAVKTLESELEWRDYGGKHYESIFTRFYQGYILPKKFKIDKRRAHYSVLVAGGQLQREDAIKMLEKPAYLYDCVDADKEFFIKKLGLENDFEKIMNSTPKSFNSYRNNSKIFIMRNSSIYPKIIKWIKRAI